jgi:hypothetical protein
VADGHIIVTLVAALPVGFVEGGGGGKDLKSSPEYVSQPRIPRRQAELLKGVSLLTIIRGSRPSTKATTLHVRANRRIATVRAGYRNRPRSIRWNNHGGHHNEI